MRVIGRRDLASGGEIQFPGGAEGELNSRETQVRAPGDWQEYVVKVHCDEGVATHVAPDPCAGVREDVGEASVGERIGQPLSRETVINPVADVVPLTEGKSAGALLRAPVGPGVV